MAQEKYIGPNSLSQIWANITKMFIRKGSLTKSEVTTALGYTPVKKCYITTASKTITKGTTISNGTKMTIPVAYVVGSNALEIQISGCTLVKGTDYKEVGITGTSSTSIQFIRTSTDGSWTLTRDVRLTEKIINTEGG